MYIPYRVFTCDKNARKYVKFVVYERADTVISLTPDVRRADTMPLSLAKDIKHDLERSNGLMWVCEKV